MNVDSFRTFRSTLALAGVLWTLSATSLAGCGGAEITAADLAEQRLAEIINQNKDLHEFDIRFNPTTCASTPWEVQLSQSFHRVVLMPPDDDGPVAALKTLFDQDLSTGKSQTIHRVVGELSGAPQWTAQRLLVVTLEIDAICDKNVCGLP